MSADGAPAGDAGRRVTGFGHATGSAARIVRVDGPGGIKAAFQAPGPRGVLARGCGRSYGDAAQNAGGTLLDLSDQRALRLDPPGGAVTVRGGVTFDVLLRHLVPRGWFVPVTPGTCHVTVGGAVAADVHGKNHHRDGSLSGHVTRLRLVTPTGVHDLGPGDDAFWATAGGMGLTGVIDEVVLRLLPIRTSRVCVDTDRIGDLDDLMARMVREDHRYRYSVAWVDVSGRGRRRGRSVLTRGDHADLDDLDPTQARDPLAYDPRPLATVPPLPLGMVRPSTIRAFNEAWYRRAPRESRGKVQPLATFFHPLDRLSAWNRLYGPTGFLQYQFVVPDGAHDVVRHVVQTLGNEGLPSPLAVLKRFGPGAPGHLSFPVEGWTLAVDLPVGPARLRRVLRGFDDRVAEAGGRVYLAKDACLRPDVFRAMYPRLDEWRQIRDRLDPDRRLQSDLARRLGLLEDVTS